MGKDNRGSNPKSLENLQKGRAKGLKRRNHNAAGGTGNSWREILDAVGSLDLTESNWATLAEAGITREWCKEHGITQYRKLLVAFMAYMNAPDSPALFREIMERTEPIDRWLLSIDLTKLTLEQLERLRNDEDPRSVILSGSGGD
jgi:hypothetical protein